VTTETWKPIDGYEGLYEVSDHGNVRSVERLVCEKSQYGAHRLVTHKSMLLKAGRNKRGYMLVVLCDNGKHKSTAVHRLVAKAFCPKVDGCDVVNHIDNNPTNNKASNLEWVTQKENVHHAIAIGAKGLRR